MTTSTALVGPLPTVRFHDGVRLVADPPKDTTDPRWSACVEHRTACDCREAELNEDRAEYRAMYNEVRQAAERILAGHPTWADDNETACDCTGCRIVRETWLTMRIAPATEAQKALAGRLVGAGLTAEAARLVAGGRVRLAPGVFVIVDVEPTETAVPA